MASRDHNFRTFNKFHKVEGDLDSVFDEEAVEINMLSSERNKLKQEEKLLDNFQGQKPTPSTTNLTKNRPSPIQISKVEEKPEVGPFFEIDFSQPNIYLLRLKPREKEVHFEKTASSYQMPDPLKKSLLSFMHRALKKKAAPEESSALGIKPTDNSPSSLTKSLTTLNRRPTLQKTLQQEEDLDLDKTPKRCPICDESFPTYQLFSLGKCSHKFCVDCTRDYLQSMQDRAKCLEIGCMEADCEKKADPNTVIGFYKDTLKDYKAEIRYRRLQSSMMALRFNRKLCPNEECWGILRDEGIEETTQQPYGSCQVCQIMVCYNCMGMVHPNQPCEKAEAATFQVYVDKNKIIQCPRCKINIYKESGCNHMRCIACQHEFCWVCKKPYEPKHFSKFNPFGCPGLQFDDPSTTSRGCLKMKAYLFWVFIILFFPLIYIIFLVGLPAYFYLKRQRNKAKTRAKQGRPFQPHPCPLKALIVTALILLGIPFMLVCVLLTVLALPLVIIYLIAKGVKKKGWCQRRKRKRKG